MSDAGVEHECLVGSSGNLAEVQAIENFVHYFYVPWLGKVANHLLNKLLKQ